MLGTNRTHLYRHFNGGKLIENRIPKGMRDVEYLGYVATLAYDGRTYRTFIANRSLPCERLMPTTQELWAYGVE